ncbi:zinc finger protein 510-like [Spodoptera frugiperda]|uniref:Zinc finger protein 510-like n=1 Tax=Spodoptera frugiperda TaxID=7108 RepID=A0A9R0ESV6_SPOFR|nr:zinc finger protein 510-like [Spodoptera frugiperda]
MQKCRICLRQRKKLVLLSTKVNGITFAEMMSAIANVKVSNEDSCCGMLCRNCRVKLIDAYNFKLEIERSEMILQETSNTKRICFSNISDIKIDIEIDTDFKPILPAMDNFYQKLVETGTNTLSYNDTLIKKIENPIEGYNENNTLSVGEFLNSIKNESDNDCDYQAYEIGANDYYSESDSNYSNNEGEKKRKKNKKKKHNGWKNSPTERPRKDGPQTVLEKPLKPKYIEDLRLVRAEPEVKPKRNRVKKPRTSKLKVCPYCGKLSKTMDYHILIHTAERKFKCDQCGSAFFTLSVLNSHMKRHTAIKKFKCDQCIAAFANERELRSHNIMHQDEKKYVCNICNKSFKRKPILKRHMMIHNFGSKPIQCELCPMTFITKYNLRHHMRVHTGERPFKCEICSQPYSYKHDFNRHCLKKHGVFLKRRSVRVMNEEVLQQERALMRELSLRAHGIIKEDEVKNPFDGPQAAQAYEQAMKAIAANKIPIIF